MSIATAKGMCLLMKIGGNVYESWSYKCDLKEYYSNRFLKKRQDAYTRRRFRNELKCNENGLHKTKYWEQLMQITYIYGIGAHKWRVKWNLILNYQN